MGKTKPHILIVDDDPSTLEMMRLILEEDGKYRVTTTELVFEHVAEIESLCQSGKAQNYLTKKCFTQDTNKAENHPRKASFLH
jgi:CheY-like chemotaxis protein